MKAFHPDAHAIGGAPASLGLGRTAERNGVVWPELPWKCPRCQRTFGNHADTVATFERNDGANATFLCATCEIVVNVMGANEEPS